MIRYARPLALAAAAAALVGCSSTQSGSPVSVSSPSTGKSTTADKEFRPTEDNQDPTEKIDGVLSIEYKGAQHVKPTERVAYDHKPPLGGAHDAVWAACNGVVYKVAVRTENLVHSLEHGAVWLSYDPDKLDKAGVAALAKKVNGKPYTVMSPYPGQGKAVSLQSWGRQLQVDAVDDERVDQFIQATRANQYLTPEPGASCDQLGAGRFDQDDPPPFDPSDPGPGAIPPTGR
ncbi:DUF3105 domain-containing protein [Actinokineospora globicatena]|uniref:DUF3105 domain-containing protein n=1 Tax=Actinokineospora globicatena TaxID=103729 RepID=A0A9W6QKG7_9PSEU|nr:DUF3105 domain-containing protein [Actinokineospora globicatena]GLW91691.1 hypothetical protein Aglo03_25070 [Actinokineospora globicatena]